MPADAATWAQRRSTTPRKAARSVDEEFPEPDWIWEGDRRMFVVGCMPGGAPFGCYEDELDDHLPEDDPRVEAGRVRGTSHVRVSVFADDEQG